MGINYSQLTYDDRVKIEVFLSLRVHPCAIARALDHDRSTIWREIKRGTLDSFGRRYLAVIGQRVHDQRRRSAGLARRKLGHDLSSPAWHPVLVGLRARWSPEQISGRTRLLDFLLGTSRPASSVSHETIYKAIHALPASLARKELTQLLRLSRGGRRRSRGRKRRFTGLQNITSIDQRPLEVLSRLIPGHWEGDLMKGANGKSCIGTLVERTSRLVLLVELKSANAREVCNAFIRRLRRLPAPLRLSLTYDRGTEMALHSQITNKLDMPVYFCHPYHPWERGTNENTNGLIRQYLPKGMDLSTVTAKQLAQIEHALNNRPRRILGFRTPQEVFDQTRLALAA